jgi:hypothetical protein
MPLPYVVGTLEMLWHWAAKFTPQGDIGKYSDKTIEDAISWSGSSGELVRVLVEKRWLDRDSTHRLVVHDWRDHADESVRKALRRNCLEFVIADGGQCPENVETPSGKILPALPCLTLPSQASPEPLPAAVRANGNGHHRKPDPDFDVWAEAAYARHPKKADKFLSLKALHETFAGHPQLQRTFDKHHEIMCATPEWREKHGRFAPRLSEWIVNDGWRSPPDETRADVPDGIRYLQELARGVRGEKA